MNASKRVYDNILETIGNTPLVKLHKTVADLPCEVYAKVEFFNPGNSIKDRMALKMLEVAEQEGKIKPGGTIIEGTSGNTGMGLALAAIQKGYRCIFTTTDKQSKEKADILKALGAEVIICPTNVEPEDPQSYYSVSKRLATEVPNSWYVNQYDNLANRLAHYEQTGPEIWAQTEGKITHLVVATGTGGTISGTGKYLKEMNPDIQVWAIDSYGSLLTKWFNTGELDMDQVHPYITEGIGEDFLPENYQRENIDHFEQVTDKDGAVMARRIAKEEGIFVGYSAGSAVAGLKQNKAKLKKGDLVVVIFHDHGSRYVGKVYNDEWMLDRGFLDVNTVQDLIGGLGTRKLVSIKAEEPVQKAMELMQKYDIEQIPVTQNNEIVASVSQSGLFKKLMTDINVKDQPIASVQEPAIPLVAMTTPLERLTGYINKENNAVLAKDESGNYHIITQYDVLNALSKG
ncbi:cystathionine beta-synthase [Taibaiella sp. KBW10]|uniref:pyridoxal-phosphate dependent enzyme n=1 Tax=Taibaiella sp. KBW10 TaxID=2153357 RepID=UPI000F5B4F6E|nr:pyridoxal-phosphate dependent enzyme [Taibaiella sp. KBW10]RQO32306.1 cystathionine beta-synthase [Taibaiella sp. KBW10]